jgi:hypothetical protein
VVEVVVVGAEHPITQMGIAEREGDALRSGGSSSR